MTFKKFLHEESACTEAYKFAKSLDFDFDKVWSQCERGDWLLWILHYKKDTSGWATHKQIVSLACDIAARALKHVPKDEKRPKQCIAVVRRWVKGLATIEEVREARRAAYAAADADAYAAYAADAAADAAAYAAYADAAAYAAYAAYAAAYAAYAAAYAADARKKEHKWQANRIRKVLPNVTWK